MSGKLRAFKLLSRPKSLYLGGGVWSWRDVVKKLSLLWIRWKRLLVSIDESDNLVGSFLVNSEQRDSILCSLVLAAYARQSHIARMLTHVYKIETTGNLRAEELVLKYWCAQKTYLQIRRNSFFIDLNLQVLNPVTFKDQCDGLPERPFLQ